MKQYWESAWDEAFEKSPTKVKPANEAAWTGYWNEVAQEYLRDIVAEEQIYRCVLDYLDRKDIFRPGDRVLDVGCGPGTYALLFAEKAGRVDALDPAEAMLATMTEEADRRNLKVLRPVAARWEDYMPDDKFDLAFTALSPAVRDATALRKLEACSARSCCLITFGQAPCYGPRDDLWDLVLGDRPANSAFHYSYPYNVLREWDREPDLEMFDLSREKWVPVDQLIRQYTTYFSIFARMDSDKERLIRDYLEERSENSLFEVKTRAKLAVISWNVPG